MRLPPGDWPEATVPPLDALLDWFLTKLDREQQLYVLGLWRKGMDEARQCFEQDHKGQLEDLMTQNRRLIVDNGRLLQGIAHLQVKYGEPTA